MNLDKKISDRYLTINQTAEYFAVSRRTVYNWLDKGLIKPARKFGKPYFKIEDLEKFDKESFENKELLTITEALEYLKISRTTFWRFQDAGKIKPIRKAGKPRTYKRTDLDKL